MPTPKKSEEHDVHIQSAILPSHTKCGMTVLRAYHVGDGVVDEKEKGRATCKACLVELP